MTSEKISNSRVGIGYPISTASLASQKCGELSINYESYQIVKTILMKDCFLSIDTVGPSSPSGYSQTV